MPNKNNNNKARAKKQLFVKQKLGKVLHDFMKRTVGSRLLARFVVVVGAQYCCNANIASGRSDSMALLPSFPYVTTLPLLYIF